MYEVFIPMGSLWARQIAANRVGCQCYVEQHMNSFTKPDVNYAMYIVAKNASGESLKWGSYYCELVSELYGHRNAGFTQGGRGSYNVQVVKCPAILVEPGFISNKGFADWVRTGGGIDGLAKCLVRSIEKHFPNPADGPIGLSVGHAFRGKEDPGAPVYDKGDEDTDPKFDDETELNMIVVRTAAEMLDPNFDWEKVTSEKSVDRDDNGQV